MTDRVERELWLPAPPEEVWDAVTGDGWLADEVELDARPGGDAWFRSGGRGQDRLGRGGSAPPRASPAGVLVGGRRRARDARRADARAPSGDERTRLRVVETRPLDALDLVATPLPGSAARTYGPALLAA